MSDLKEYEIEEFGEKRTDSYRVFFRRAIEEDKSYISPLHDIRLVNSNKQGIFRMIVEISRWSNAKMEICKSEPFNPIKQDLRNGILRYVKNCFPYHGYIWNYGTLPQTWEMPSFKHPGLEDLRGDNNPLDVIEIGSKVHPTGSIIEIKILGALALIDDGVLDWKIISIDINDPLADKLNDLNDLRIHTPGLLKATLDWFRIYKVPDGSGPNKFGFNEEFKDSKTAIEVINTTHFIWKSMINNELKENKDNETFKLFNATIQSNKFLKTSEQSKQIVLEFKKSLIPKLEPSISPEKIFFINQKNIKRYKNKKIARKINYLLHESFFNFAVNWIAIGITIILSIFLFKYFDKTRIE